MPPCKARREKGTYTHEKRQNILKLYMKAINAIFSCCVHRKRHDAFHMRANVTLITHYQNNKNKRNKENKKKT